MSTIEPLKDGHPYKLVVMSVDFVGSTNLKVRVGETKAEQLLGDWQEHMLGMLPIYHGHRVAWGGDGGVLVFEGDGRIENALHAGLHALHYPLARYIRPLIHGEPGHIRVALHHGIVQWSGDPGKINSKEIDLVCKLEKEACEPDALLVSEAYFRECGQTLQKLFTPKGEVRGGKIYSTTLAAASRTSGAPDTAPYESQFGTPEIIQLRPSHSPPNTGVVVIGFGFNVSGLVRDSSYMVKITLQNQLDKDIAWVRLKADYFDDEEELIATRYFNLGKKDSVKPLLGAGKTEKWAFMKQGIKHATPTGDHSLNHQNTEVYGTAKRAELTVIDVRETRKAR